MLNLELWSNTNATTVAVAKITRERGWRVGKKVSLCHFLADQKIAISWKKCVLGHPIARVTSYCLLPDTFWLQASKNAFKVGSVKFANSLSPPAQWSPRAMSSALGGCRGKFQVKLPPKLCPTNTLWLYKACSVKSKGNVTSPGGLPWQIPGKVATQVVSHQHTLAVQGMLSEVQGQCHQPTHYPKSCNQ